MHDRGNSKDGGFLLARHVRGYSQPIVLGLCLRQQELTAQLVMSQSSREHRGPLDVELAVILQLCPTSRRFYNLRKKHQLETTPGLLSPNSAISFSDCEALDSHYTSCIPYLFSDDTHIKWFTVLTCIPETKQSYQRNHNMVCICFSSLASK